MSAGRRGVGNLALPGPPSPIGDASWEQPGATGAAGQGGLPKLPGPVVVAPAVVKSAAHSPLWGAWLNRMGGPGIMELLNSAGDVAEVTAVLLWMLEEDLAEVEPVFGSLLPGKHLGL